MDVTCRNKKLSTDKNRIVKAVVFVACILLTVIYGILIFNACKQREQAWNRQAKAAFLEAVGNELKKLDKMEKYGSHTVTSLFQQKTLEADIPDSVVFALQDGTHVYHLPLHRRNNAYFKDGDKNVYLSLILEKYPFPFDSLHYAWDKQLALSDIKGKTGVCSRITDLSGKVSSFASGALEEFAPSDSLVSTYLGYRLEIELSGYISYSWWSLLPGGMVITVVLLWCMYIFFLLFHDRLNQLVSKRTVVEEKVVEKTPLPVNMHNKSRHISRSRIYKLDNNLYFDAGQHLFCNDNGIIEKLSPAMSVLLEHFFKAPDHTLSRYEIYRIIGKDIESYSLDNFYKMMGRFRNKLEQVSSVTLHNDGNGSYRLVFPLELTDMN